MMPRMPSPWNPDDQGSAGFAEAQCSADTWRIHILGPDDIHPMLDELTAFRQCNITNITLANIRLLHANDPNYPWAMAVVERTPDFTAHCVRTITSLEIKLNELEEKRERELAQPCPTCAKRKRTAVVEKLKQEQASPPMPPIE